MRIGRKTKGPARAALKIIVAAELERGLWPWPLPSPSGFVFFLHVVLLFLFWEWQRGAATCGNAPFFYFLNFAEITSNARLMCGRAVFFYLINRNPFNVSIKTQKK